MQPHFMSSGDLLVDRRYQWALDYLASGDRTAAADILEQVVAAAPAFAAAWFVLADLREAAGDRPSDSSGTSGDQGRAPF